MRALEDLPLSALTIKKQNCRSTRFVVSESEATESRSIELPVSSEYAVERWGYREILSHAPEAVDLQRLNDGANLLFNHCHDKYLGVVESARLSEGRLYVRVLFDSYPFADQIYQSVRAGMLRNVSIGYEINDWSEERDGSSIYIRATRWTPLEVSLVTVPADPSVGIGRSKRTSHDLPRIGKSVSSTDDNSEIIMPETKTSVNIVEIRNQERDRIAAIRALCDKWKLPQLAQQLIDCDATIEQARAKVLDSISVQKQEPIAGPVNPIGLDAREQRKYSICKAILYRSGLISESDAKLEVEASSAIASQLGKSARGIYIPTKDLGWTKRDLYETTSPTVGSANTIETELLADSFIKALRNNALINRLGARVLSDLNGDLAIPRQASTSGAYWVGENTTIPEDNASFDQIKLTPKHIAVRSRYTRQMLQQSSLDIESFVREDLIIAIALGIDAAVINGAGGVQPLGILNYPGVFSVDLGVNGGSLAWADIVQMETMIATANALTGSCYYLTNPTVKGALKTTLDNTTGSGRFIWNENRSDGMGSVNGYGAAATNQVPGNLAKGTGTNLSAMIFGDFSQIICGMWGVLDLLPNPYGAGYEEGNIQIRAMQTMDIEIRRPEYFAVATDIAA